MNYYYLVAGLADISFDNEKSSYSVSAFREEIYPSLTEKDRRLVDLIFQQYDQRNLLALLRATDTNLSTESILANAEEAGAFSTSDIKSLEEDENF
jgi:vacuolar-type H+-ATPase subunit C/Vma6